MKITRQLALSGTMIALTLSVAACSGGSSTPSRDRDVVDGGTLVIADSADTPTADTAAVNTDVAWRLQALVYDTLMTVDGEGKLVPGGLTESFEQPSDTQYIFTLRQGLTFSNGRALTPEDVVGSLERLLDPKTQAFWATQLGQVKSIKAVGDNQVQIDLVEPYTPLLAALANFPTAALPMEELKAGTFDPTKQMLGTGPFMVENHVQDESWTFVKNAEYRDAESVSLDRVEVKIMPDDATRVAALRDGTVDLASFSSPDAPLLLEGVPNVDVTVQGSSDMYWLELNAKNPDSPFSDPLVRQAVAYAVDREALIETVLGGEGEPTSIAAATLDGACATDGLPTYERDVDKAKDLLSEAGVEDLSIELIAPPYLPTFADLAQVLQQSLGEAGIDVRIKKPEYGDYIDSIYVQNPSTFDAVVDFFAGYADPTMVPQFLTPERNPINAGFLIPNQDLTDAVVDAAILPAGSERDAAVQTACEVAAQDAQVVPLSTKSVTIGARSDLVSAEVPGYDAYDVFFRNIATYGSYER